MAEPILELDNVTVRRGMGVVLAKFSLTVKAGECVLLHGENGAGTSTVIETAARLLLQCLEGYTTARSNLVVSMAVVR